MESIVPNSKTSSVRDVRGTVPQEKIGPNPYLDARRSWDERYGDLLTRARNWRALAFVSALVALVSTTGLAVVAARNHFTTFIVAVDKRGNIASTAAADQPAPIDDKMKRAALFEWVTDLRTVTVDGLAQRRAIDHVYSMIASGSPAEVQVSDFYRGDPPAKRAETQIVEVQVQVVLPTSDKTYEVEWVETTRSLNGQVQGEPSRWKGAFTLAINPPHDEQVARANPLGIYVTQASWSRVL